MNVPTKGYSDLFGDDPLPEMTVREKIGNEWHEGVKMSWKYIPLKVEDYHNDFWILQRRVGSKVLLRSETVSSATRTPEELQDIFGKLAGRVRHWFDQATVLSTAPKPSPSKTVCKPSPIALSPSAGGHTSGKSSKAKSNARASAKSRVLAQQPSDTSSDFDLVGAANRFGKRALEVATAAPNKKNVSKTGTSAKTIANAIPTFAGKPPSPQLPPAGAKAMDPLAHGRAQPEKKQRRMQNIRGGGTPQMHTLSGLV